MTSHSTHVLSVCVGKMEILANTRQTGTRLARILVQFAIYRRLQIGRDGRLDQSEAYDVS